MHIYKILWNNFSDIDDYTIFSAQKSERISITTPLSQNKSDSRTKKIDNIPLNDFWWDVNK